MRLKEEIAREILTEQLLRDFKSEITGEHQERVVGINPEEAFFVGKLMSINNEEGKNKAFSSKTFIESISVDFYISEKDIENAVLTICPKGEFFYRAYPTLDEQRQAVIRSVYETTNEKFASYDELASAYKANPGKFVNTEIKLVPVYKKMSITEKHYFIHVKLKDILQEDKLYGYVDEKHEINKALEEFLDQLMLEILLILDIYRFVVNEKTKISHLSSEEELISFINSYAKNGPKINQRWNIYVEVAVKKLKDRYLVSVSLVNNSKVSSDSYIKRENDKKSIETLFNSGLQVSLTDAQFQDIEMDYFADDYKYDRTQKAIGTNCTVVYDKDKNIVYTEHLPVFTQYRFVTNEIGRASCRERV